MIKLIDRYLIKNFLGTFFYVAMIFTLISVVVDFSQQSSKLADEPVTYWQILSQYYLNFIPWINSILWPIFILISVIFFTSRLAKNSEILSIFNAGVSYGRFLRPYLIVAGFLFLVHLIGNHYVVPIANKTKFGFENKYIYKGNDEGKNTDVHFFLDKNVKAYVRYYDKRDTIGRDLRLEKFEDGNIVEVLIASRMEWVRKPHVWRLKDYVIHRYDGIGEELHIHQKEELDTTIAILPDDFVKFVNEKDWLTSNEINTIVQEEKLSGRANTSALQTEFHRRTADSFSIIILTIIGVAVASRKVRGGVGLHLAMGVIIGALYIFLSRFAILLAVSSTMPPLIAVWIPNVVFGIISVYLLLKAQK